MAAKKPAKKAAPRKKAAAKKAPRLTAAQRAELEERNRALQWSAEYAAPMRFIEGWDPDTGKWAEDSPVDLLLQKIGKGLHRRPAAGYAGIDNLDRLLSRGNDYRNSDGASEDRSLIPIEVRPFVDLSNALRYAEAALHASKVEILAEKADEDMNVMLRYLARRFPDEWREQQEIITEAETDPRHAAMREVMRDPNNALKMAEIAEKANDLVSRSNVDQID